MIVQCIVSVVTLGYVSSHCKMHYNTIYSPHFHWSMNTVFSCILTSLLIQSALDTAYKKVSY